jgi:hypothetical protein
MAAAVLRLKDVPGQGFDVHRMPELPMTWLLIAWIVLGFILGTIVGRWIETEDEFDFCPYCGKYPDEVQ